MDIRCSTQIDAIRKCNKYLGTYDIVIGRIYCKSCGKKNYYEVITEQGLDEANRKSY